MRKTTTTVVITALLSLLSPQSSYAKDACKTMLCMSGMTQGKGVVDNCNDAIRDYFNIVKKRHGDFNPGATKNARGDFLGECRNDPDNWKSRINDIYGTTR